MGDEMTAPTFGPSIGETTPLPPFPLVKVVEFVYCSLVFALSRATLGVGALYCGSVFVNLFPA